MTHELTNHENMEQNLHANSSGDFNRSRTQNTSGEHTNGEDKSREIGEDSLSPTTEESSESSSSISYNEVIESLNALQNGYSNLDANLIAAVCTEDCIWREHPHDDSRCFRGREEILAMFQRKFENKNYMDMAYHPDTFIIAKYKHVYVEWLTRASINKQNKSSIKEVSHAVKIRYHNNKIRSILFHSTKTNEAWTKKLKATDAKSETRKPKNTTANEPKNKTAHESPPSSQTTNSKAKKRNDRNKSGGNRQVKPVASTSAQETSELKNNTKNKRRRNNRRKNNRRNGRKETKQDHEFEKPIAEDVAEDPKNVSRKSRRRRKRRKRNGKRGKRFDQTHEKNPSDNVLDEKYVEIKPPDAKRPMHVNGKNGRHGSDGPNGYRPRYFLRPNSLYNNRKYGRRRGHVRGSNTQKNEKKRISKKNQKYEWVPWVCSKCQTPNTAKSRICTKCTKPFRFIEDLSPERLPPFLTNTTTSTGNQSNNSPEQTTHTENTTTKNTQTEEKN